MHSEVVQTWQDAGHLRIDSPNVSDFLQGYLTIECQRLNASQAQPFAVCNLKGRVVVNGWAYLSSDAKDGQGEGSLAAHLIVKADLVERLASFLAPYLRFARGSSQIESCPLVVQKEMQEVSHSASVALFNNWHLVHDADVGSALESDDASPAIMRELIDDEFAWVDTNSSERFLPQMLKLGERGAVDFDKGCYLGQEVVARAQFRGAVKRQLQVFQWQGDPPETGAKTDAGLTVVQIAGTDSTNTQGIGLGVA